MLQLVKEHQWIAKINIVNAITIFLSEYSYIISFQN